MSSIKRIIKSRPSERHGYFVCDIRYPGSGRAEQVEITELEYRLHRLKESFDDAGVNMKIVMEFEKLAFSQGYGQAVEDKKKESKCQKHPSFLNFWKSNSQPSGG